jgi:hypothetical protein
MKEMRPWRHENIDIGHDWPANALLRKKQWSKEFTGYYFPEGILIL